MLNKIRITGTEEGVTVLALGIYIGGNDDESGEYLKIYGVDGYLLLDIDEDHESFPNNGYGWDFLGVDSGTPITVYDFNESGGGGDDICIKTPCFGVIEN